MAVVQYDSPLNVAQAKQALLEEHRSWIGPLQAEGSSKRVGGDQQLTPGLSYIRTLQRQNVQADFHVAFREQLKLCHMDNPDAKAMTRLLLTFPSQMQAASLPLIDPYVAVDLYQKIKDLPGTETCVNIGGRRLQQAVTAMHEVNLLHTDFKAANVFVDSSGAWFMGDIGASNLFGDESGSVQRLCTQAISNFSKQITSMIAAC
ncbi:hypothetical protein WJX77_000474 [Trebouxia sp. C0004]